MEGPLLAKYIGEDGVLWPLANKTVNHFLDSCLIFVFEVQILFGVLICCYRIDTHLSIHCCLPKTPQNHCLTDKHGMILLRNILSLTSCKINQWGDEVRYGYLKFLSYKKDIFKFFLEIIIRTVPFLYEVKDDSPFYWSMSITTRFKKCTYFNKYCSPCSRIYCSTCMLYFDLVPVVNYIVKCLYDFSYSCNESSWIYW